MNYEVPAFEGLNPGVDPTHFSCLIAMAQKPEKTAGGVILTDITRKNDDWRASTARLVAVSPHAFSYAKWDGIEGDKPSPGDVVYVGEFAGADTKVIGQDGREYRLIPDTEIRAVIERASKGVAQYAA